MNKIRWGLIGCGDVARKRVARSIIDEPHSRLVAACRRNQTRLREFCDSFGIELAYTDAGELIADANIDAVYIATPVAQHLPLTLASAAAGKHVLVEKPMGMSVAECDQMVAACRTADVKLAVAYYRRFYPIVDRMRQLIAEGVIGTPLAVSAVTATPLAIEPGEEGYWRVIGADGGGGALMDVGSHRINVFLHLFGPIAEVKAFCQSVAADYESEDTAVLLMRFRSGMMGTLQCHFGADDPDEFTVQGTSGRLLARPLNGDQLVIETSGGTRNENHPPASNFCSPLVADFVDAIRKNREPKVTGQEGRETNQVMEWAYADH